MDEKNNNSNEGKKEEEENTLSYMFIKSIKLLKND